MTITANADPNELPNQSQSQEEFDQKVAKLIGSFPLMAQQMNELAANLNAIAAGGAYALAYKWGSSVNASSNGAAGGYVALGDGTNYNNVVPPASAVAFYIDTKDASGASTATILPSLTNGNASVIKGHLRVVKVGDPSKWARFAVTSAWGVSGTYFGNFAVSFIDASSATPFAVNDLVMLLFQRTGDKGDTGAAAIYPYLKVADQKSNGSNGGSVVSGWVTRTLNTTVTNTITGASLSADAVTLPAGTYDFRIRVPGIQYGHRGALYNGTDATYVAYGANAKGDDTSSADSWVTGRMTLSAAKSFVVRTWIATASGSSAQLGPAVASGSPEIYTEAEFWKVL